MLRWIIAAICIWLAYQVREQFPPFIVGMIIAYLLSRPVSLLCRYTRISRGFAVAIIYVLAIGLIGYAGYKGLPSVADQATSLFAHREMIVQSMVTQLSQATGWNPDVTAISAAALVKLQTFVTGQPEEWLAVGGVVSRSLLFILMAFISSIYFLYDSKTMGRFLLRFVPEGRRAECAKVVGEINHKFSLYIGGELLLIVLMAVMTFCILSVYHVRYSLIVALIAGVAEIIPVFGPLAAQLLACSITASQFGLGDAGEVLAVLWAVRLFQDYVIIPRVIGHTVQLHPLFTMFFVLAGETLAGGLGMLLAVPAAAAVKVVLDRIYPPLLAQSYVTVPVGSAVGDGVDAVPLGEGKPSDCGNLGLAKTASGNHSLYPLRALYADLDRWLRRCASAIGEWLKSGARR
ncbi:MAG: AI-2E family transporter [Cyanobacteria bacterium REEB67]|nr:AI-2E family transporter [Cyanobacteria bacterium REEB67]